MTRSFGSRAPAPVCGLLGEIERVFSQRGGKPLSYSPAEALGLLVLLRDVGRVGRVRLSRLLGLGEQGVRNLVRMLSEAGLVEKSGWGVAPGPRARLMLEGLRVVELLQRPSFLEDMGWRRVALVQLCLPRPPRLSVGDVLRLRDLVVAWGGLGAVVLVVGGDGRAVMVGGEETGFEAELSRLASEVAAPCAGVEGFVGFDSERGLWGSVYGFLEGLCRGRG